MRLSRFRIFLISITIFFLIITGYFYKNISLSYPFIDEQEVFAIGKYLLNGEKLYKDIITNHQPVGYIASAFVQKITNPNTTFMLLEKHRLAIILWSALWSLIFVAYFDLGGLLFVIIYELTKSYMFGSLFLSETLIVHPLLFLTGLVLSEKKTTRLTLILLGLSLAFALFSLGPIWPALAFLSLILVIKLRLNLRQNLKWLLIGVFVVVLLVAKYSSVPGYFYYNLYLNTAYTVPQFHSEPWSLTVLKSFATPLISLFKNDSALVSWVIKLLSLLLIINIVYQFKHKKYYLSLVLIILLGLSNIRFVNPGAAFNDGFHLLPWYGVLVFVTAVTTVKHLKKNNGLIFKLLNLSIITAVILVGIKYSQQIFYSRNKNQEYTINYSTHTDIGSIIKIMKDPKDTLFVSPDNWLIYWQSDTNHIPGLFGYYAWFGGIPSIHSKVLDNFSNNPPVFFYCENCKNLDLGKFLDKYREVKRNNGNSYLYVLPARINNLTNSQRERLKFYGVNSN